MSKTGLQINRAIFKSISQFNINLISLFNISQVNMVNFRGLIVY